MILILGVTYSRNGFDAIRSLAVTVSFIYVALLWWIYLEPASGMAPTMDRNPPRLAAPPQVRRTDNPFPPNSWHTKVGSPGVLSDSSYR